jgi:hypothetical protein
MKIPFIVAILIATYTSQAEDVDKESRRASKFVFYIVLLEKID